MGVQIVFEVGFVVQSFLFQVFVVDVLKYKKLIESMCGHYECDGNYEVEIICVLGNMSWYVNGVDVFCDKMFLEVYKDIVYIQLGGYMVGVCGVFDWIIEDVDLLQQLG